MTVFALACARVRPSVNWKCGMSLKPVQSPPHSSPQARPIAPSFAQTLVGASHQASPPLDLRGTMSNARPKLCQLCPPLARVTIFPGLVRPCAYSAFCSAYVRMVYVTITGILAVLHPSMNLTAFSLTSGSKSSNRLLTCYCRPSIPTQNATRLFHKVIGQHRVLTRTHC